MFPGTGGEEGQDAGLIREGSQLTAASRTVGSAPYFLNLRM
jgi:hypothetical protein